MDLSTEVKQELEFPKFASCQPELDEASDKLALKWQSFRYQHIKRPYNAASIVRKRGALYRQYPSNLLANSLWYRLRKAFSEGSGIYTHSVINPVQGLQASRYLEAVCVSGNGVDLCGQHFSEPAPGTGDYSYDSVASMVGQLFKSQEFHDKCQRELHGVPRLEQFHDPRQYQAELLTPIIADADSGHGSLTGLMKFTRMVVEQGAAAIQIDDQASNTKASVLQQGKVLAPVSEAIGRMLAIRVQLDILDSDQLIFSTTAARDATLITSDIDRRDHSFILGATRKMNRLTSVLGAASDLGASEEELNRIEQQWLLKAELATYPNAVANHIRQFGGPAANYVEAEWFRRSRDLSLDDQMGIARGMGVTIFWNAELARTSEGYYRYAGSIEAAISRSINYLGYADLLMLESDLPNLNEAIRYSTSIHSLNPTILLGYQLPTLKSWHYSTLTPEELPQFQPALARYGFCYQYLNHVGFQSQALVSEWFSEDFKNRGLIAYIEDIQRPERYYQTYTNYRYYWTGAEYNNRILLLTKGKDAGYNYGQLFDHKNHTSSSGQLQLQLSSKL